MNPLAQKVFRAGVVGAGGAGFPTHIKISAKVEWVIANGAECEPLLYNDQAVMCSRPRDILRGLRLVMRATGARKSAVAVKKKYRAVISVLDDEVSRDGPDIVELGDYYPAGDEHEIVNQVTGRVVPEAGIPLDVGVLVQNVETLCNIAAAADGSPVTSRCLTVGGCVTQPRVLHVPLGTPVGELLEFCGGAQCSSPTFLLGGTMMGALCEDPNHPVDKTTAAVIVLPSEHPLVAARKQAYSYSIGKAKSACTQCVLCTEVCNRYLLGHNLEPHKIMRSLAVNLSDEGLVALSAMLCSECGCCEHACPMDLSPRKVNQELKRRFGLKGVRYPRSDLKPRPRPEQSIRRIPAKRVLSRLGLTPYDRPAPLSKENVTPKRVRIPLKQHAGVAACATVKEGDRVKLGQLVGEVKADEVGALVHSSINGRVAAIDDKYITIEAD